MSVSDYAAWWGASVATLALGWNIYRGLRSGPRVKVTATPDMQSFTSDKRYILVRAINRGGAPTTITHLVGVHTKSFFDFLRRRRKQFISPSGLPGDPVPYVLKPGEEWSNVVDQADVQRQCQGGYLYMGIIHNQRKRAVYARVHLPPTPSP